MNSKGSVTISGGNGNMVSDKNSVVTGGQANNATGLNSVVLGGRSNAATGPYAFIGGGNGNVASGSHSIAMGQSAYALNDHSMVINLQGVNNDLKSTEDGQFMVRAKQYRFQISTDTDLTVTITEDNIENLQNAIDSQPGRRHLMPVRHRTLL